jgi:hypothetical protein
VKSADRIRVNGSVELGGTLRVTFLDGFWPRPGTTWNLLSATGGFSGTLPRVDFGDATLRATMDIVKKGKNGSPTLRLKFLGKSKR